MIYQKEEPKTIQYMFDSIAKRYDLTNRVLSFNMHKLWNKALVKQVLCQTNQKPTLVDLCSGTGDIAIKFLQTTKAPSFIYLVDFSAGMLGYAKQKFGALKQQTHAIEYVQADVQQLPLPNQIANCATMAYGIRNVKDPKLAFKEAWRILQPNGTFAILELTRPKNSLLRKGHQLYLRYGLPLLGKLLTKNPEAYRYLCQSIDAFITPDEIKFQLSEQGFVNTKCISLLGGIATIIVGKKPL